MTKQDKRKAGGDPNRIGMRDSFALKDSSVLKYLSWVRMDNG
jgi:hypothetical protein